MKRPALIAFGICLVVCVAFYPGFMSTDSIEQLTEARAGAYSGWHPALMAFVWRQLDGVWPGPLLMVAFHTLMFGVGIALYVRRWWAIVLIVLCPPVLSHLGTAWKDTGMMCALVLVSGLGSSRWGALPLFYAAGIRHNAVFAIAPLAGRSPTRWMAVALGVFASWWLVNAPAKIPSPMQQQVFTSDLLRMQGDTAHTDACEALTPFKYFEYKEDIGELRAQWLHAVAHDPIGYLRVRWETFRELLGIGRQYPHLLYYPGVEANALGVTAAPWTAYTIAYLKSAVRWPWGFGWVYLLALPLLWWRDRRLMTSAWLYVLPYFVISPACDLRYLLWTIVASLMVALKK